ncbi:PadR family transcriptional regulator [Gallibacter intestinalis]|uniref:PadR family transcriptional regulator n=1 Tax=Gallibacter intestinalis TaxID=2779356 RepID=A0ABR9QV97_9FIRM|nr:PadR family transcriptional regulator [Gallibacter intestinalis]MBE5034794.1 PadR family transcriptional regulator [Gallibacter intestinalis]
MGFKIESALLEACVLSVVMKEDTYGYMLTQSMKNVLDISESTLYPVLRRLQKEEYLATYDEPFQGRNRRYYTITDKGRAKYAEYVQEWKEYKGKIDKMLAGGGNDE